MIVIALTNSEEGCRIHLQVRVGGQARSCWKRTDGKKAKSQETQINSIFEVSIDAKIKNNYHVCIAVKWM